MNSDIPYKLFRVHSLMRRRCPPSTFLRKGVNQTRASTMEVHCERLDDIYTGTPSLMKIDVEGHELKVLKGAEETIKKHKPAILIEIHDFSEDHDVHKFMMSLGYGMPERRPEEVFLYLANSNFSIM